MCQYINAYKNKNSHKQLIIDVAVFIFSLSTIAYTKVLNYK